MAIRDNKGCTRVFLYSYSITITGWGDPPNLHPMQLVNPRSPNTSKQSRVVPTFSPSIPLEALVHVAYTTSARKPATLCKQAGNTLTWGCSGFKTQRKQARTFSLQPPKEWPCMPKKKFISAAAGLRDQTVPPCLLLVFLDLEGLFLWLAGMGVYLSQACDWGTSLPSFHTITSTNPQL